MDTNDWKKLILSNEKEVKKALERAYVYGLTNSADVVITNKGEVAVLPKDDTPDDAYALLYIIDPNDVSNDLEESKYERPDEWVSDAIKTSTIPEVQRAIRQNIINGANNLGLITSEGKPDYYEIIEHLPVIDRRAADRINAYEAKKLAPQKADELFDEILSAKSYSITNGIPFVPFSKESSKQSINSLFSGTPFEDFENELIGKCSYTANFDNIVETAEKIADAIDNGKVAINKDNHSVGQER